MRLFTATLAAWALVLGACTGGDDQSGAAVSTAAAQPVDAPQQHLSKVDTTLAPSLKLKLKDMRQTASGLYILDVREGSGPRAEKGRTVRVHYTGWLTNGNEFDSSLKGSPIEIPLGAGRVIKGWDEGIEGMRLGGRRMLVIPPELGYGKAGQPGIPGRATLVFQIDLLGVR